MAIAQVVAGARILISDLNAYFSLLKGSVGETVTLVYNAAGSLIFQPSSDPAATTQLVQVKNNAGTVKSALTSGGGGLFSNPVLLAQGADIASATTTDLSAATGNYVHITGTTTITGLGTVQAGTVMVLKFDGILTLTHNATTLILRATANATTAAGDVYAFVSEGSGNWREIWHLTASTSTTRTREVWLNLDGAVLDTGTPDHAVRGANTRYSAWAFDAAAVETVATQFLVPGDWSSGALTFKIYWTNLGAGAGNVRFTGLYQVVSDAGDLNANGTATGANETFAAPAQNILKITTLATTITPASAGQLVTFYIGRDGANGADTLANDCGIIGVKAEYTAVL